MEDISDNFGMIGGSPVQGFRNKIINGDFDISQRGTVIGPISTGYTLDRWLVATPAGITCTAYQLTRPTNNLRGMTKYARFDFAGSGGSQSMVAQRIENVRTLAGKQVTVSFYCAVTVQSQVTVRLIQKFGTGGSPSPDEIIVVANPNVGTGFGSLYKFTATLPSISTKTIGTNENSSLELRFTINVPTTTMYLGHVSLVEGDATNEDDPFEPRHLQQELALCQRYYYRGTPVPLFNFSSTAVGQFCTLPLVFPVTMRTTPSLTSNVSDSSFSSCQLFSFSAANQNGARILLQSTAAAINCNLSFGPNSYFEADAEL